MGYVRVINVGTRYDGIWIIGSWSYEPLVWAGFDWKHHGWWLDYKQGVTYKQGLSFMSACWADWLFPLLRIMASYRGEPLDETNFHAINRDEITPHNMNALNTVLSDYIIDKDNQEHKEQVRRKAINRFWWMAGNLETWQVHSASGTRCNHWTQAFMADNRKKMDGKRIVRFIIPVRPVEPLAYMP